MNRAHHITPTMSRKNSNDESDGSEYDDDEDDEEEDESPGKRGTYKTKGNMQDMIDLCEKREREIRKLKLEIRKLKTQGRTTKAKMREEFQWDGDDAILADKVSDWVKNYLFPRYKFLKKGWMDYSEKEDSLSSFVKKKNAASIPMSSDYRDLWDRVICPTIANKYITIRCNLANDIRATYKGKNETIMSFICS